MVAVSCLDWLDIGSIASNVMTMVPGAENLKVPLPWFPDVPIVIGSPVRSPVAPVNESAVTVRPRRNGSPLSSSAVTLTVNDVSTVAVDSTVDATIDPNFCCSVTGSLVARTPSSASAL